MLDSVEIKGLRGVGNVELEFDATKRARVMFGVNGVGKTKTLEALYIAALLTHGEFVEYAATKIMRGLDWVVAKSVTADGREVVATVKGEDGLPYLEEAITDTDRHARPVALIGAGGRSSVTADPRDVKRLGEFSERREGHFEGVVEAIKSRSLRSSGMTGDIRGWFVQRAQSVNPYQAEKDNLQNEIDSILALLHAVDRRVASDQLRIDGSQRVYLKVDGRHLELSELSSGFASVVKLFQAIISSYSSFTNSKDLQNLPGLVFIDEIESHLHVSWQTTIVQKLKALFPNSTFFIATHSPLVLTQLEQGEAYLLERESDGVVRSKEIDSPNMKAFADVLEETFGVDLNVLKRNAMIVEDQESAKSALLDYVKRRRKKNAAGDAQ